MHRLTWIAVACLALLPTAGPAKADNSQIPPKSLEALQDMFSTIRDGLWEKTDEFWHSGDYERCIATMRLITRMDPRDIEAYDDAAWLMQNQFRDDEAEQFLKEGLRNNPSTYDMYFSLGFFYYMHTRFDEAVPCLIAATAFECPIFVRNELAHAYEHAGYVGPALDVWIENEYVEPDDNVPRIQIDRILRGEAPDQAPEMINKWRQERKEREGQ